MKKVFIISTLLVVSVGSSLFAEEVAVPTLYAMPVTTSVPISSAVTVSSGGDVVIPSVPEITSVVPVTEKAEILKTTSLSKMKARGAQMIKERINSLNSNAKVIANAKGLTLDQKASFSTFFNSKVTELTTLNTNLANSSDATTTKSLVASITNDFRIYGVVIPQVRLQKRLYELQNHATKVTESFAKVQVKINEAKIKGKDVSVWQSNLDVAKVLVASTTATIPGLLTQVNNLKPIDYGTTSKSTIESVNKSMKQISKDLQSIGRKVKRPELKNMKAVMKNTASSTREMR